LANIMLRVGKNLMCRHKWSSATVRNVETASAKVPTTPKHTQRHRISHSLAITRMHSVLNRTNARMIGWLLHYAQGLYLKGSTFESWPIHRLNIMRLCSDPLGHMPGLHHRNSDTATGTACLLNNSINYLSERCSGYIPSTAITSKDLLNKQSRNLAIYDPDDEVFFPFLRDVHDVSLTAVAVRRTFVSVTWLITLRGGKATRPWVLGT